jgi:hypothetical protein
MQGPEVAQPEMANANATSVATTNSIDVRPYETESITFSLLALGLVLDLWHDRKHIAKRDHRQLILIGQEYG